jgi:hypothetical protein
MIAQALRAMSAQGPLDRVNASELCEDYTSLRLLRGNNMPRHPIPFGRHSSHFTHIQNALVAVLNEIKSVPNLKAKVLWVSCRLNRTGQQDSPVFAGWVESNEATEIRVAKGFPCPPIDIRFGDTHQSAVYSACFGKPLVRLKTVIPRTWGPKRDQADPTSQKIGENFYGETHRRSIAIAVVGRYVGTLNAGFLGNRDFSKGNVERDIERILIRWAQRSDSRLVNYIQKNLQSSGPVHP